MSLNSINYSLLDADKSFEMLKLFKGERTGWVQVGEKKWFFPYQYTEQGEGFLNFKARPTDTWVLSYPRSGKCFEINFTFTFTYFKIFFLTRKCFQIFG